MTDYRMPWQNAESEFVEKRSRFISKVWKVSSEEEAKAIIAQRKKEYYDARHNCWCYLINDGGIVRYSDDGEPQGTAGQPMLGVFQKQDITNVCCVVTRYFGGILLGAGGLTRAYSKGAAEAMLEAGICEMKLWSVWLLACPYGLFERVKLEVSNCGGVVRQADYGANITMEIGFPKDGEEAFVKRLKELSAGQLTMEAMGDDFLPVKLEG
ncbi:YigZ family protein [Bengtsoniella intestinalis]|uniref:YigZ family protein n=1 Tax=Bengtsoniella intestinalis TaxID=3073143 RepID=UPI00391FB6C2